MKFYIMSKKKISSFEKMGYTKYIPRNVDDNHYETMYVKDKLGNKIKLYRNLKRNKIDDTTDFNRSWDTYNKLIMITFLSFL